MISYLGGTDGLLKHGDTTDFDSSNKITRILDIKIKDFKSSYKVKEQITLTQEQVDEFSNILINYKVKDEYKKPLILNEYACYMPRNSVIFFDENEKVICNFEICFECFKTNMFPDYGINLYSQIEECSSRFDVLKNFFKKNGIKYGTEDR